MNFENNWKSKTIEELENDYWGETKYSSHLVTTCHNLRKKQLLEFSVEDLRIMIGQNFGLDYLIPLAIDKLAENILVEGDFYEGDLLKNVLTSEKEYWKNNKSYWQSMCKIFLDNKQNLDDSENMESIKEEWLQSFSEFETINK